MVPFSDLSSSQALKGPVPSGLLLPHLFGHHTLLLPGDLIPASPFSCLCGGTLDPLCSSHSARAPPLCEGADPVCAHTAPHSHLCAHPVVPRPALLIAVISSLSSCLKKHLAQPPSPPKTFFPVTIPGRQEI